MADRLTGQALMLSLSLLNLVPAGTGWQQKTGFRPRTFVYSAITVFVHPGQQLRMITEGTRALIARCDEIIKDGRTAGWSVLCHLPWHGKAQFFPCHMDKAFLILPAPLSLGDVMPIIRLDKDIFPNEFIHIGHLHVHVQSSGLRAPVHYAMLPLVLGAPDPMLPYKRPIDTLPLMWLNAVYCSWNSHDGGNRMPSQTCIMMCDKEFHAQKSVLSLDTQFIRLSTGLLEVAGGDNDDTQEGMDVNDEEVEEPSLSEQSEQSEEAGEEDGTEEGVDADPILKKATTELSADIAYKALHERDSSLASPGADDDDDAEPKGEGLLGKDQIWVNFTPRRPGLPQDPALPPQVLAGTSRDSDTVSVDKYWKKLDELAASQLRITKELDQQFTKTASELLRRVKEVFLGTGGIAHTFVDDMAAITVKFLQEA